MVGRRWIHGHSTNDANISTKNMRLFVNRVNGVTTNLVR